MKRTIFFACAAVLALTAAGCDVSVEARAAEGGVEVSFAAEAGDAIENVIRSLSDGAEGAGIFDADEISRGLSASGARNVEASADGRSIKVSFLAESGENSVPGALCAVSGKKLSVVFSRETMRSLYAALPDDARKAIDLAMAPAFSDGDDDAARGEYVELLSQVYGQPLARELEGAELSLALASPSLAREKFTIPLIDILLAQKTIERSISWK